MLPEFIPPMLARIGEPFDSDRHLFEVKWDGMRVLTFVEEGGVRLLTRSRRDVRARFPELEFLGAVEPGALLDGELVAMVDGKPDFRRLMSREQARDPRRVDALARQIPVQYVVFDLPYRRFESIGDAPLSERREQLGELVAACGDPRLVLSDGVVGPGTTLFEQVTARGMEGVVAKRLDSPYLPGKRTDAWQKIKGTRLIHCLILGWIEEDGDLRSLVIATEEDGVLVCVGRVGSGLGAPDRERLLPRLHALRRDAPLVEVNAEHAHAEWVEPGLYCIVSFLERTSDGLRAPVFMELIEDGA